MAVYGVVAMLLLFFSLRREWMYSMKDYGAEALTVIYPLAFAVSSLWSVVAAVELIKNHRVMPINELLLEAHLSRDIFTFYGR